MPSVAYAMRDLHPSQDGRQAAGAVTVPTHRGGCGVCHEVVAGPDGRFVIECDACAPALIGGSYGWSADPAGVPLTPDEIRANELATRDAQAAQSTLLSAMTTAFVNAIQAGGNFFPGQPAVPAAPAPTLKDQLAALSAEDRADLLAELGITVPSAVEDAVEGKPERAARRPPQPARR